MEQPWTAIRDQFKHKIRNRTTALRKGPPINIEPGSGGWARSTRFFGHSWQAAGTAGIGWADPKRTWQSKRGIICKELAWWSLEGVRYSAKPSANLATMDFPWKSRWFLEVFWMSSAFLLPTSRRLRFDFSYEASSGVSVADIEKVETLVSGLSLDLRALFHNRRSWTCFLKIFELNLRGSHSFQYPHQDCQCSPLEIIVMSVPGLSW
jgi:hypothetical protein